MEIGAIIKKYRIHKNMKQEDMANALGITPQAVSRWETGISYPDITMIPMIAKLLDVTTDKLLGCDTMEQSKMSSKLNQNQIDTLVHFSPDPHRNKEAITFDMNSILNQSQIDSIFDYIPNPSGKLRNVLVVDDADFMRMILEDMLTKNGHYVIQAKDGMEAFDLLKKNQVDICLLDIVMPGMHGLDVLKKIREQYPDLIVIMLSAQSLYENIKKAVELGANGFIAKPFNTNSILERM